MKRWALFIGLLLLFLPEVLRVYFIMPFPGSQMGNTVAFAYWLSINITWIRLLGLALILYPAIYIFKNNRNWERIALTLVLASYAVVFFYFNYRFEADKIFRLPVNKSFGAAESSTDRSRLVIGVVINGEAKAYPIQIIGYHHQVMDTIGNTPVMITYCTVCRTGRAFSPIINGKTETFRLVGMDHFNAVFEDAATKSWWQQATGLAITGPLKGTYLKEFQSRQATLESWMRQYPNSLIMEPDMTFSDNYFKLEDYDRGTMHSKLVKRDLFSWKPKSWVIGVRYNLSSKAYDWNELVAQKIIQDSIEQLPILLTMEMDTVSFHAYDRRINGAVLLFRSIKNDSLLSDHNTNSTWNMDGLCIEGPLKGQQLAPVQAYNEFWHSWQTFHSNAVMYKNN